MIDYEKQSKYNIFECYPLLCYDICYVLYFSKNKIIKHHYGIIRKVDF